MDDSGRSPPKFAVPDPRRLSSPERAARAAEMYGYYVRDRLTLEEVGRLYGVSRARVKQVFDHYGYPTRGSRGG